MARGAHPPPVQCQRQLPSCSRSASRHLYGQRKDLKDKRDSWRVPKGHLVQPPAALLCLQEVLRKTQYPTHSFGKHPNIGEEGEKESNQVPPTPLIFLFLLKEALHLPDQETRAQSSRLVLRDTRPAGITALEAIRPLGTSSSTAWSVTYSMCFCTTRSESSKHRRGYILFDQTQVQRGQVSSS